MPEPSWPNAWFPWSNANTTFSLRSFDSIFGSVALKAPEDERVRQRIMRQLLAEGLKPNTSKFTRKLELELRRHENARRRPRPEIIDTPKKPKEDEQTRRSRQEAQRVRDEEEI